MTVDDGCERPLWVTLGGEWEWVDKEEGEEAGVRGGILCTRESPESVCGVLLATIQVNYQDHPSEGKPRRRKPSSQPHAAVSFRPDRRACVGECGE